MKSTFYIYNLLLLLGFSNFRTITNTEQNDTSKLYKHTREIMSCEKQLITNDTIDFITKSTNLVSYYESSFSFSQLLNCFESRYIKLELIEITNPGAHTVDIPSLHSINGNSDYKYVYLFYLDFYLLKNKLDCPDQITYKNRISLIETKTNRLIEMGDGTSEEAALIFKKVTKIVKNKRKLEKHIKNKKTLTETIGYKWVIN